MKLCINSINNDFSMESIVRHLFLGVLILLAHVSTASAQGVCTGLLSYTGRDLSSEARENSLAASLFSEHCEGSSSKRGSSTSVGLEAVVKAIPIKFSYGGSSNEEKLNNFCKVYDQRRAEFSAEKIDRSLVVRDALNAFNQCIGLASKDIYFNPLIGRTSLVVDIRRGSEDASLTGVSYDSSLLSCRLPEEDGKGPSIVAGKDTVRALKAAYLPLSCERVPQTATDGTKNYPALELTIGTSRGSLLLPIAADALLPLQFATEVAEKMKALESRTNELDGRPLSCQVAQNSAPGHYPSVDALIPLEMRKKSVLTGGGCMMNQYPALPHNGTFLQNRPLDDRSGWHCAAGDPPNIPLTITVTSYAIYCATKAN